MKMKKKLPLNHKWRCDKIGSRVGNPSAREKALAEVKRRAKEFAEESPKGFISAPTLKQLNPTPREAEMLGKLWNWQEQSKKSTIVLGKPST